MPFRRRVARFSSCMRPMPAWLLASASVPVAIVPHRLDVQSAPVPANPASDSGLLKLARLRMSTSISASTRCEILLHKRPSPARGNPPQCSSSTGCGAVPGKYGATYISQMQVPQHMADLEKPRPGRS